MHTRSLVAAVMTASLAVAPVVPATAATSPWHDPIAHIALGLPQHGHYVDPLGKHKHKHYVDPLGHKGVGKAIGKACATESMHHVKGQKGTPFSECVKALAQAAKKPHETPAKACTAESKRHVKGTKGTPFSRCVSAVAKLRHATTH